VLSSFSRPFSFSSFSFTIITLADEYRVFSTGSVGLYRENLCIVTKKKKKEKKRGKKKKKENILSIFG